MSNTQFTPGKWYAKTYEDGMATASVYSDIAGRTKIADLNFSRFGDDKQNEVNANANLIAAAPDMYEAIRQLVNFIEENKIHVGTDGSLNEDLDWLKGKAKAALSKANPQKQTV